VRERYYLEDIGVDGEYNFEILRKWGVEAWTGLIWLWLGTGGGHL
jgi:hypothetical protein